MSVATKERPVAATKPEGMKLTIDRGNLLRALSHAAGIVNRTDTIPVLANVLLDASGDKLRITSTNIDMQVSLCLPATIEGEGKTTVAANTLHAIVREMDDGSQVEFTLGTQLQVRSGRSNYKLHVRSADEFPVLQLGNALSTFTLPAADLLRCLKRVEFAQSVDVTRYYICGVHLETADGKLVFAATDGNCLSFATLPAPDGADVSGAILPSKLIATLTKLLDGHDGDVRLFVETGKVTFEIGSALLTGKLIDGTFPNWRRVLPRGDIEPKRLLIGAETLERAIRRVTIIANEKVRAVKFELGRDKLTASCTSPEYGHATEEAPCVWDSGDFVVGFNGRMLLEAIRASGADELQVDLIDPAAPPLFSNPADESAKFVVMPRRV